MSIPPYLSSSTNWNNPLRAEAGSPKRATTLLQDSDDGFETAAQCAANALAYMHLQSPEKEERIFDFDDMELTPERKLKSSKSKADRIRAKDTSDSKDEKTSRKARKTLFKEEYKKS